VYALTMGPENGPKFHLGTPEHRPIRGPVQAKLIVSKGFDHRDYTGASRPCWA
jgi:hypothetical protein